MSRYSKREYEHGVYKKQKAFSLLEVVISVLIGSTAFLAIFTLAVQNLTTAELTKQRFIAANLAQEGIEIVANMRSSNWLTHTDIADYDANGRNIKWRGEADGIAPDPDCALADDGCIRDGAAFIAQHDSTKLRQGLSPLLSIENNSGLYCHGSLPGGEGCSGPTTDTLFSRTISITTPTDQSTAQPSDHQIAVTSTVTWSFDGKTQSVGVEARLYNWQ